MFSGEKDMVYNPKSMSFAVFRKTSRFFRLIRYVSVI